MNKYSEYYTLKGYQNLNTSDLTYAMEDYLEMIYRITLNNDIVKVGYLSEMLNVKPSSASKMIQYLSNLGYLETQKYGLIKLTEKGRVRGEYLLFRHNILHRFLCAINKSENELEQVEKIEHYINKDTLYNIEKLLQKLE